MNPESRLFIDGKLIPAASGKTYPNVNPATEEIIGEVADAGPGDMERAIVAARRAFDGTHWSTDHAFRLKCLKKLKSGLLAEIEDFKLQIAAETGAPLGICGNMGPHCEVPIGFMDYTLEALPDFLSEKRHNGMKKPNKGGEHFKQGVPGPLLGLWRIVVVQRSL